MNPKHLLENLDTVPYNQYVDQLVGLLRQTNQNVVSDTYFRGLVSFYLCQVASTMRCFIDDGTVGKNIPVNCYALLSAASGFGKTKSVNVLENDVLSGFYTKFLEDTLPELVEASIHQQAVRISNRKGTDYDQEKSKLETEYDSYGSYVFSFPEGSGPAYRQIRANCQFANIGSTNLIVDEIGYNISKLGECLDIHFEVFDVGLVKDKITKSSSENKRYTPRFTPVPANMLCFGTSNKLFDGGATEKELNARLESGYARRFIYGIGKVSKNHHMTAEELYDALAATASQCNLDDLYDHFLSLADISKANQVVVLERAEGILLTQYKMNNEALAETLPKHAETLKAELQHRHFRALKIAGSYAFIEQTPTITEAQLLAAIKVVEDSGEAFKEFVNKPKPHVRLAQFIAESIGSVTRAELMEELPFFPSAKARQDEMMVMATAWGYKNHCLLKGYVRDGIDFYSGETLKKTKLDNLIVSYGTHDAYGYTNANTTWEKLQGLCLADGYNFVNHHLDEGHRSDDNVQGECNFMVIDCDGEVTVQQFAKMMEGTLCYMYTTKSHTQEQHRFRAIIPLKYHLKLSKLDYKEFVNNFYQDLPYNIKDDGGNQRSKKWMCNAGASGVVDGELFDPLPYLPNTKKNAERLANNAALKDLNRIQKFFARNWHLGRNNCLLRYATMLMDAGEAIEDLETCVIEFNNTFSDALPLDEIERTVFVTIRNRMNE